MGDKYPRLKVAAAQASSVFLDRDATVAKACHMIEEAGDNGANLVVFPECFLPGYPYWYFFYPAFHPMAFKCNHELLKNSIEIPGEATEKLCQSARKANIYVVMGIDEVRHGMPGTVYNSQLFIHRDGSILGKHQKLMPSYSERLLHALGDGSTLRVFDTEYGPIGGLCCGENGNPLFRFALLCQGELIHAANWPAYPDPFSTGYTHEAMLMRARNYAFEGKVFVVSSADVLTNGMLDIMEIDTSTRGEIREWGGYSAIFGPGGQYLAGPAEGGDTIIYADIDLEQLIDARMMQDFTGHYNRFDVVSLNYNPSPDAPLKYNIPCSASEETAISPVCSDEESDDLPD
jgi:nitrilase